MRINVILIACGLDSSENRIRFHPSQVIKYHNLVVNQPIVMSLACFAPLKNAFYLQYTSMLIRG